jgi:hypothetical protein
MDTNNSPFNWRDHLKVHPAADLFPRMSQSELQELADDMKRNGVKSHLTFTRQEGVLYLIDGINRLDMAINGWLLPPKNGGLFRISADSRIQLGAYSTRFQAIVDYCSDDP